MILNKALFVISLHFFPFFHRHPKLFLDGHVSKLMSNIPCLFPKMI